MDPATSCPRVGSPVKQKKLYKVQDKEWVQPRMRNYIMGCCDCGLVHRVNFRIVDGRRGGKPSRHVQMQASRAEGYTRRERKGFVPVMLTEQLIDILVNLHCCFGPDALDKIRFWMMTKNPHFGFISPVRLLAKGRGHKVLQFIEQALDDNKYSKIQTQTKGK